MAGDHATVNRLENSAGDVRADGQARIQIGDSYSHSVVNNYLQGSNTDSHLTSTDIEQLRIEFLRRLRTSPYNDRKNRNPKRVDGTCEWFTTHDLFQNWQQEVSAMLWVSADPGCGKSVLTRYLVDDVLSSNPTRTTCYFFFKDDFDDQKTLEGALCCILHQLFVQKPALLLGKFLAEFQEEGEQLCSSFNELWRILVEATGRHDHGEIICILDALDECKDHRPLAAALTQFYNKGNGDSTLKFLVTSRPYLRIGREFQDLKDSQPTIHLGGENPEEVDKIAQEISIVIKRRTEELGRRNQLPMEELQIFHDEITSVRNRTYLWVYLVFDAMEQAVFLSKAELRSKIHELPHTVEEAYDGILRRSCDPDKARKILHIVVAAERPLRLTEMATALAFRGEKHRYHEDLERDLASPDSLRIAIRETCGLFVVIQASEIFLIHQTAREFLVQLPSVLSETRPSLKWQYALDPEESHHLLSEICINYLLLADFERPIGAGNLPILNDEHQFGLLEYAASNWTHHYRQARIKSGATLECLALQLCDPHSPACLHWLGLHGEKQMGGPEFAGELPTSLLIASYFGLDKLVDWILQGGKADLNARGASNQRTALSWASAKGYDSIVQSLLGQVSELRDFFRDWTIFYPSFVNRRDEYGRTPLWYAAVNGHRTVVQLLLSKNAKVDIPDENGLTPLSCATHHGYHDIVALLLGKGARQGSNSSDLEAWDRAGRTPLHKAAERGDEVVLKLLLDQGADINAKDGMGRTALAAASYDGNNSVVKLLLDRGANTEISSTLPLIVASGTGHYDIVKLLLDGKAVIDAKDDQALMKPGSTALMYASIKGDIAIVQLLLDRGANINLQSNDGWTALMHASFYDCISTVELLLDRGANIHHQNSYGWTVLMIASAYRRTALMELLLDRGANVNDQNKEGRNAWRLALDHGHKDVAKLLLRRGASKQ